MVVITMRDSSSSGGVRMVVAATAVLEGCWWSQLWLRGVGLRSGMIESMMVDGWWWWS